MHRVVLDTSVVVSGFRSASGASRVLLRLVAEERIVAVVSPALMFEYEDVLKRPRQRAVHRLSDGELDAFFDELSLLCDRVITRFQWRPQLADANDELVLEAAVNGLCQTIVTHNIRDFADAERSLGIRAVTPATYLRELAR